MGFFVFLIYAITAIALFVMHVEKCDENDASQIAFSAVVSFAFPIFGAIMMIANLMGDEEEMSEMHECDGCHECHCHDDVECDRSEAPDCDEENTAEFVDYEV